MSGIERTRELDGDPQDLLDRQRAAQQSMRERFALQVLHHQELDAVLTADVVQRADMRVRQARDGARLAPETFLTPRVVGDVAQQDLDRNRPIEPCVDRPVDFAHAARAKRRDDFVRPQSRARRPSVIDSRTAPLIRGAREAKAIGGWAGGGRK